MMSSSGTGLLGVILEPAPGFQPHRARIADCHLCPKSGPRPAHVETVEAVADLAVRGRLPGCAGGLRPFRLPMMASTTVAGPSGDSIINRSGWVACGAVGGQDVGFTGGDGGTDLHGQRGFAYAAGAAEHASPEWESTPAVAILGAFGSKDQSDVTGGVFHPAPGPILVEQVYVLLSQVSDGLDLVIRPVQRGWRPRMRQLPAHPGFVDHVCVAPHTLEWRGRGASADSRSK